jgi:hypothetical protein
MIYLGFKDDYILMILDEYIYDVILSSVYPSSLAATYRLIPAGHGDSHFSTKYESFFTNIVLLTTYI